MRTNMKIVTIATVLLTASLLAGCGDAGNAADLSKTTGNFTGAGSASTSTSTSAGGTAG